MLFISYVKVCKAGPEKTGFNPDVSPDGHPPVKKKSPFHSKLKAERGFLFDSAFRLLALKV